MRILGFALAALIITIAPSTAQTVGAGAGSAEQVDALAAQREEYRLWIEKLDALDLPALQATQAVLELLQSISQGDLSARTLTRVRAAISDARAAVAKADVGFANLETPEFPLLEFPEAVNAVALREAALQANANRVVLLDAVSTMINATERRDLAALQNASAQFRATARVSLRAMGTTTDGRAVVYPPGSINNCMYRLLSVLYRTADALAGTISPNLTVRSGPQFQGKIEAMIGEVDEIVSIGGHYATQQREAIDAELAAARAAGNSERIVELEGHRRENDLLGVVLEKGRAIGLYLRATLTSARSGRPLTFEQVNEAMERGDVFRKEFDALSRAN